MTRLDDLERIRHALRAAAEAIRPFTPGSVPFDRKAERDDPVTAADRAADAVLRKILPRPGEGWLSEESADDPARLDAERVWVVDPIDGTREFIEGLPKWCISIGLVEGEEPVAGGIFNPASEELVLGSVETGVTFNGQRVAVRDPLAEVGGDPGAGGRRLLVGASRSEARRGEWSRFEGGHFEVRPCGSVAYKLGLVAAGRLDATWTLVPKREWDVAAGAALVRAGGGEVTLADGREPRFNQAVPEFPNFVAAGPATARRLIHEWLREHP